MTIAGSLIRYHRLKQGLKQLYICRGICAVSYLSKIESGKAIASDEIVHALFDKLGITYNSDVADLAKSRQLIMDIRKKIVYHRQSKHLFKRLLTCEKQLIASPLVIDYLSLKCIYVLESLYQDDSEEALNALKILASIEDAMTQPQKAWYYYALAQLRQSGNTDLKFPDPIKKCEDLYTWAHALNPSSLFLFKRMVQLYQIGQYDASLEISSEVIHYALLEGNVAALAHTNLIVGNCFAARGMVDEMLPHYRRAFEIFDDLENLEICAYINYNIGATYLQNNALELAEMYLIKSLSADVVQALRFSIHEKLVLLYVEQANITRAKENLIKAADLLQAGDRQFHRDSRYASLRWHFAKSYIDNWCGEEVMYHSSIESLCRALKGDMQLPRGYYLFYKRYLLDYYTQTRQYKKALDLMQDRG